MKLSISVWIEGARPKTLIASVAPICIITTYTWKSTFFSIPIFFSLLGTALFLQIATNYANDYFDYLKGADQKRIGPRRLMACGIVTGKQMQWAIALAFALAALFATYLIWTGGLIIAFLLGLACLLALAYTGGPKPLAYFGGGDIVVFIFFGPFATFISYYLLTGNFSYFTFLPGIISGSLSTAILVINNLRDRLNDSQSGKKTLVVRFGHRFGVIEYQFLLILSVITPCILTMIDQSLRLTTFSGFAILPLLYSSFHLHRLHEARDIAPYLQKTAFYLGLSTIIFCISLTVNI